LRMRLPYLPSGISNRIHGNVIADEFVPLVNTRLAAGLRQ